MPSWNSFSKGIQDIFDPLCDLTDYLPEFFHNYSKLTFTFEGIPLVIFTTPAKIIWPLALS